MVRFIDDFAATLGEGPLWSPHDQALYWLDTMQKKLLRLRWPGGRTEARDLPYRPSCMAFLADGRLIIAYKKGIGLFEFDSGKAEQLALSGVRFDNEIFNDGACDRAGRFWIGTRDREATKPNGALYRLGPDLAATRTTTGLVVSNGMAWSPDGRTFYHTESRPGRIDAYDFDVATGAITNPRPFLEYQGKGRRPDGCTVDAEGGLWVAEIDGARVARYRPDGRLDREIMLPIPRPTSVMFGGDGLATLFITSMRHGVADTDLGDPRHGMLMAIEPGVRGMEEPAFDFGEKA